MEDNFEFIINAIVKVAQVSRSEGLMSGVITINGSTESFLGEEDISITIERSQNDPESAALVSANINGKSSSEDILKEILYDVLDKTNMLDAKLKMKLDIVFNKRKMRFENGKLIME